MIRVQGLGLADPWKDEESRISNSVAMGLYFLRESQVGLDVEVLGRGGGRV